MKNKITERLPIYAGDRNILKKGAYLEILKETVSNVGQLSHRSFAFAMLSKESNRVYFLSKKTNAGTDFDGDFDHYRPIAVPLTVGTRITLGVSVKPSNTYRFGMISSQKMSEAIANAVGGEELE